MTDDLQRKPIDEITFDDIQALAGSGAEESLVLELKRDLPANTGQRDPWMAGSSKIGDPARNALAKEIVAFANAFGGMLVVGIDETDDFPKRANGLASELIPKVTDCADRLRQSLQSVIDPPVRMLEVRGIAAPPSDAGVLVLRVGGSPLAPHGYGRPPAAYVHRGPNSEPLTMRDMHALFFETRARQERIADKRAELAQEQLEVLEAGAGPGIHSEWSGSTFKPSRPGLLSFRCSLIAGDDLSIDNLPDHLSRVSIPDPKFTGVESPVQLNFHGGNWRRAYRAIEHPYVRTDIYSKASISADGTINLTYVSTGYDSERKHALDWFAAVIMQGMVLSEWLRRWSGRPDVEYVLDGEFRRTAGPAPMIIYTEHLGGRFSTQAGTQMTFEHANIGPYSLGPRAGFEQAFDVIERELWDLFGLRRSETYAQQLTKALELL